MGSMGRTIFIKEIIKEIITIESEPRLCPTCQKEDRLERDIIREGRSNGRTVLCSRCEALTIVTKSQPQNSGFVINQRRYNHAKRAVLDQKSVLLIIVFSK